ncbi:MAG: hypothetical protein OCD76_05420 [Reichenbachiella sp.]
MHLIYSTNNGEVFQDDVKNRYQLNYKGQSYHLSVCSFIAFKSKLEAVEVETVLLSDQMYKHIEIISLCNLDRVLVLTIDEVIELRDLVQGGLVMLELNSIVHHRIRKALV